MFHLTGDSKPKSRRGIKHEVYEYKKRMRIVSTAITLIIIFSLAALGIYYLLNYARNPAPNPSTNGTSNQANNLPKAALIDALYCKHPNEEFTRSLNKTLSKAGFKVDIYQGEVVTVDFLKKLPSGYDLIILRMHSALSSNNQLYFFTAEPYSVGKYTQEQYFQLVKEAYASNESSPVFAVNWGFIKVYMTGKFNDALVIAMGCDGTRDPLLIQQLIDQGATGYIAWNGPVSISHSDKAILYLVQALYIRKLSLTAAVQETNSQVGKDPYWGTSLECYVP